jgi:hypothetical protein
VHRITSTRAEKPLQGRKNTTIMMKLRQQPRAKLGKLLHLPKLSPHLQNKDPVFLKTSNATDPFPLCHYCIQPGSLLIPVDSRNPLLVHEGSQDSVCTTNMVTDNRKAPWQGQPPPLSLNRYKPSSGSA